MEILRRTTLSDAAYQRLLSMIHSGRLKSGDRLPSKLELTKKLGVSRTAKREGIKATEGDEDFHLALCAAAHNKILEKIAWPLANHATLRRWKLIQFTPTSIRWTLDSHREIFDAIRDHDPDKTAGRMVRHLEMGEEKINETV